ncbi:MAG: hypothetical protein JWO86_7126 [Myxococcaceae bacterium]|nr:hypothetical protein [Myxococcaceae bacterium]MEA2752998.1 hypothetical protein [Myxococcales bacterium]
MESTIIRQVNMTAMLVGPNGRVADDVAMYFSQARVHVVRVMHSAAACERLAVSMPQVVVVLGTLRADERDALADRATAVGALLMYFDPELDAETLQDLVARAAQAAVERKLVRDESGPAGAVSEPPGADEDVDSKW